MPELAEYHDFFPQTPAILGNFSQDSELAEEHNDWAKNYHTLSSLGCYEKSDVSTVAVETDEISPQLPSDESELNVWRGVFSPAPRKKVLFSKKLKIRLDELPRLKPHIRIDRRTLANLDDD